LLAQRGTPDVRASVFGPDGLNDPASSTTLPLAFFGGLPYGNDLAIVAVESGSSNSVMSSQTLSALASPSRLRMGQYSSERRASSPPPWPNSWPTSALAPITSTRVQRFWELCSARRRALRPCRYTSMSCNTARTG
jgi:hypothetical protein